MIIKYKGEVLDTMFYEPLSDKEVDKLREQYYKKPTLQEVRREVKNIMLKGNITIKNIVDYYLKEIMGEVVLWHSKWSINDAFTYKPILEFLNGKSQCNDEVYPPNLPKINNILTAIRLGGKGVVSKPSNFKIETVIKVLKKYNINNNYYDPSCGWAVRMIGSLACGVNYFGTDPNYKLTEQLQKIAELFWEVDLFAPSVDIRTQGSEIFIPEYENKMGVIFTSPPYFFLEDYKLGEQSTKLYPNYKDWLNGFLKKTFENNYKYLIDNGHMLINIKNYKEYDLEERTIKMAQLCGFDYIGIEDFENISRINLIQNESNNNEKIFVFKKGNPQPIIESKTFSSTGKHIKYLKSQGVTKDNAVIIIARERDMDLQRAQRLVNYSWLE